MEIKDLAGISKPLTKLIEVIAKGVGAVSRASLIRRDADATAYSIRTISEAVEKAEAIGVPVISRGGIIDVWKSPEDGSLNASIGARARARLEHQEMKRQENIEQITSRAAEDLVNDAAEPSENVNEDWVSRFFNTAQDVSSVQMQVIWSRVLSGEVKKPGSFSLKTLDFLRNLTAGDAAVIERVGKYSLNYYGLMSVVFAPSSSDLISKLGLSEADFIQLVEMGVLYPNKLVLKQFLAFGPNETLNFVSGEYLVQVTRGKISGDLNFPIWKFTPQGSELLSLISIDGGLLYLEAMARFFADAGGIAIIGRSTGQPVGNYEIVSRFPV